MISVGITQRVTEVVEYNERRDCLDQRWGPLFWSLRCLPVPLLNTIENADKYISELDLDAVVLTGGNDLCTIDGGTNVAPERDAFECVLLEAAIDHNLPVLGVCRGAQLLNIQFGGSLSPIDGHVATKHSLSLVEPPIPDIPNDLRVNSYHNYGIRSDDLAEGLDVAAQTADGSIEWFFHESLPISAIMWHPERGEELAELDRRIIHTCLDITH